MMPSVPASIRHLVAAATVATLVAIGSAAAQDRRTYYTVQHPEQFTTNWGAFYERIDALTADTRKVLPHHLDLAYGADPKQKLDLYLPAAKPASAPVFVFIHGGGFREGDRANYGFVAGPMAAAGIVTAVVSYRLLPHVYPDQVEDLELAVSWLVKNVTRYGGDPGRIFIGGHSAGAILSSLLAVTTDWTSRRGLPADVVKGAVPVSGPYDLRQASGFVKDFLPDPSVRERASPALRIGRTPPVVVAFGEKEGPYDPASRAFADAIRARGGRATLVKLDGLGHDGTALAMADASGPLVKAAIALIVSR